MTTKNHANYLIKSKTVFGFPLYKKERISGGLKRSYILGLFSEILQEKTYSFSFLGFTIISKKITNGILSWSIGIGRISFPILKSNLYRKAVNFFDSLPISQSITPKGSFKYVFILNANSGEIAFLLGHYWKGVLSKNKISEDNYLFLCTKPYHQGLLKIFFPESKSVVLKPKFIKKLPEFFSYKNWKVQILFPSTYFNRLSKINNESDGVNFLDWMSDWLDIPPTEPAYNYDTSKFDNSFRQKLSIDQLNAIDHPEGSKLIIVSLTALTYKNLDRDAIAPVLEQLQNDGFVLYFNTDSPTDPGFLSYPEIFALAKHSRALIALRSGLVDFLSFSLIPCVVIYTEVDDQSVTWEKTLKIFSLKEKVHQEIIELHASQISDKKNMIIEYIKRSNLRIQNTTQPPKNII